MQSFEQKFRSFWIVSSNYTLVFEFSWINDGNFRFRLTGVSSLRLDLLYDIITFQYFSENNVTPVQPWSLGLFMNDGILIIALETKI